MVKGAALFCVALAPSGEAGGSCVDSGGSGACPSGETVWSDGAVAGVCCVAGAVAGACCAGREREIQPTTAAAKTRYLKRFILAPNPGKSYLFRAWKASAAIHLHLNRITQRRIIRRNIRRKPLHYSPIPAHKEFLQIPKALPAEKSASPQTRSDFLWLEWDRTAYRDFSSCLTLWGHSTTAQKMSTPSKLASPPNSLIRFAK